MLENQFIQFYTDRDEAAKQPVTFIHQDTQVIVPTSGVWRVRGHREWNAQGNNILALSVPQNPDVCFTLEKKPTATRIDVQDKVVDATMFQDADWLPASFKQELLGGEYTTALVHIEETGFSNPSENPVLLHINSAGAFIPGANTRVGLLVMSGGEILAQNISQTSGASLSGEFEIMVPGNAVDVTFLYAMATNDAQQQVVGTFDYTFEAESEDYSNVLYSSPIRYVEDTAGFTLVSYRCDEDAFGFPFRTANFTAEALLPIILKEPQYGQEDKTYETRSGRVVTLYAKYYKERTGQTEYIPEAMHDKIIAALSCDEVRFDGILMTKSGEYDIDWGNHIDEDYVGKLAMATFKVRENITHRNTNY